MKEKLLDLLACPVCGGDLLLADASEYDGGEIVTGVLSCKKYSHEYKILRGVPRFADLSRVEQDKADTAENFGWQWQDLIMASYKVEPALLEDLIPHGTELDLYQGECYLSLVAFKFADTAVMGVKVPFHTNFEEINLRFYVQRKMMDETRRGVVFIKEIVSRPAICWVANSLFGENYETWNTGYEEDENEIGYYWSRGELENGLSVEHKNSLGVPADESREAFIIEHYWGYTRRGERRTDEYLVEHPKWELFEVNYAELEVDFAETYGERFAFLSRAEPDSVLLAKGSEITVYRGQRMA